MTIGQGSFALKKFRLLENTQKTPLNWIVEKMQNFLISPLGLEDTKEESIGFCHPFSGEPNISNYHSLIFDNAFLFGLRLDKKKVPATFLKLQLMNALESLGHGNEDEQGKVKKLSKKIKDSLKDKLKQELLAVTLPSIRLVEILWHLDKNEIWLLSTSSSVCEIFERIFFDTFEIPFVEITAGTSNVDFDRLQLGLKLNLQPLIDLDPIHLLRPKGSISLGETNEKVF